MSAIAAALVNWNELWKIILSALVGGTGVVIVFALLLLGISRGQTATKRTTRYGLYTLSGLCGILVLAVAAIGIYAMTQKPSSTKPKPKTAAATFAPASATEHQGLTTTLARSGDHKVERVAAA
jgi:NADH:ubiquinone oxidoreductase subunit 6 (subunit J)